jgi:hypothetical protein
VQEGNLPQRNHRGTRGNHIKNQKEKTVEEKEALKIVKVLADGIDPYTGEVLSADGPYQNPQTVRALFIAADALERIAKSKARRRDLPERAGRPWDEDESKLVIKRFDEGADITEIAKEHKRTTGAIRSQLLRLGRISQ